MKPLVVWFRRDLRVDDNTALHAAARLGAQLIPLFIFDDDIIRRFPSDGTLFDFQAEALEDLRLSLRSLGGDLIVRRGAAIRVHEQLIDEFAPAALFYNKDYHPAATERDLRVSALWKSKGLEVHALADVVLHEPDALKTREGRPYVVFTPYANAWKKLPLTRPLGPPKALTMSRLEAGIITGARALKRPVRIPHPIARGGESQARARWKEFLHREIAQYQTKRDAPAKEGTSMLSPYLRFGCISVRRMAHDLEVKRKTMRGHALKSIDKFRDELIWRDFYMAVLFHHPRLLSENYRQGFDHFPWDFDESLFDRWRSGRTGFPLVDAGMRQLNQTGWMHNRVRMVVASFLTKDLMHDWRIGERVFEEKLLDIETASNNGGWQWAASTGVDPRPLRIFNPELQSRRFDPLGEYILRWVPELRAVPPRFLHAPHEMSPTLQKEVGCVIGRVYPRPAVDHKAASQRYKAAFAAVKEKMW